MEHENGVLPRKNKIARMTYLDKNGTADSRFRMNQASDTSVGLRNTNGATLDRPFLRAFAFCTLGLTDD